MFVIRDYAPPSSAGLFRKRKQFQSRSPGHISEAGVSAELLFGRRAISWPRLYA